MIGTDEGTGQSGHVSSGHFGRAELDSRDVLAPRSQQNEAEPHVHRTTRVNGLDRSLAGSLAWQAAANWSSQILTWASFLIVARLLSPADFGIVSMAVILFSYLRYAGELGIPITVVTLRDLTESQLAQLNTVAVILGLACFAISCALAFPAAMFFRTPKLVPVVVAVCSALVALGVRAVPEGLLSRDMRFRWLSLVDGGCDVLSAAVTLVMAWRGFAYWALVIGNLVAAVARSALIVSARPHPFAWPRLASIRKELLFGWHVLVSILARSAYERLDNLTAGRTLGAAALGFYGMAWSLANVPLEKLTTLVTTIIPSYLAAVQSDLAALRRYLRGLTEVVSLALFPATVGLGLVAPELVPLVLGRKWGAMVPALQVLCPYIACRSLTALLDKVLTAVGNPRFVMRAHLTGLAILPCAFYCGSHWGIRGIAWGWVVAYPCVALPIYWKTFRMIRMKAAEYFASLRPALDGSVAMIFAVEILRSFLSPRQPLLFRLVLEVATGATIYLSTVLLVHRDRALAIYKMTRGLGRNGASESCGVELSGKQP
jgi:teichuronic acid exporter